MPVADQPTMTMANLIMFPAPTITQAALELRFVQMSRQLFYLCQKSRRTDWKTLSSQTLSYLGRGSSIIAHNCPFLIDISAEIHVDFGSLRAFSCISYMYNVHVLIYDIWKHQLKSKIMCLLFNADVAAGRSHAGGPGWYVPGSGYDGRWRPPDHTHHARLARHCKLNGTLRLTRTSLTAQLFLTVDYISLQTCALCNSVRVKYTSAYVCR